MVERRALSQTRPSQWGDNEPIHFTDAFDRHFYLAYELCNTWKVTFRLACRYLWMLTLPEGFIQTLMNSMADEPEVIWVQQRVFALFNADGVHVPVYRWDESVKPGDTLSMACKQPKESLGSQTCPSCRKRYPVRGNSAVQRW